MRFSEPAVVVGSIRASHGSRLYDLEIAAVRKDLFAGFEMVSDDFILNVQTLANTDGQVDALIRTTCRRVLAQRQIKRTSNHKLFGLFA